MRLALPLTLAVLAALPGALRAQDRAGRPAPTWARYRVVSTPEGGALPVQRVTITTLPAPGTWCLHLQIDAARELRAWLVSDRVPMRDGDAGPGTIRRYIVREGDEPPLEYVNAETNAALLPPFQFSEHLLPRPAARPPIEDGFATAGYLLGHVLSLEATGEGADAAAALPAAPERLALDPGLLIGTSRNFRDTASGRVEPPPDYPYRRLTREEYEEMRAAGANEFIVDDEQADWLRRRAFYHKALAPKDPYPEILYRSTYLGQWMFIDEPAIRLMGDPKALDGARRPKDLARLIETRTRTYYAGTEHGLAFLRELRARGVNLGFYEPVERDIPVWETEYASAWYQLAAGPSGLVHEGRYQLATYQSDLSKLFGPGLRLSAEEMLELHVAFLRGAARGFASDWGVSIYGQCDTVLAPLALTMAYDRGARFLWFWTSDHEHHMPYREQIDLMRHVTAHAKAHPRRPRAELRRAADVAVALPDGYTLAIGPLWGSPYLQPGDVNAAGVEHREVVAAAMWEGVVLAKQGIPFDFIVDDEQTARHGYRRVIRIGEDAKVSR